MSESKECVSTFDKEMKSEGRRKRKEKMRIRNKRSCDERWLTRFNWRRCRRRRGAERERRCGRRRGRSEAATERHNDSSLYRDSGRTRC